MTKFLSKHRVALAALIAVWSMARVFTVIHTLAWTHWEIWEAHKFLDYGFFNRHGAAIDVQEMTGRLPHPEDYNFVDHPYPILWFDTLVYWIFGAAGVTTAMLALRLAALLVTFQLLQRYFDLSAAWIAAALYSLAPDALSWDGNSNVIALGAIMWPFVAALALKPEPVTRKECWLLGLLMFAGGQISWFTLVAVPTLLLMAAQPADGWKDQLRNILTTPKCKAILAGAILSGLLFFLQIVVYAPDFGRIVHYVSAQGGIGQQEVSRAKMLLMAMLRGFVWVGPALWLGAIGGSLMSRRNSPARRALVPLLLYFVAFALTGCVLTRFYFVETSPYAYLLFPATFLTAFLLNQTRRKLVPALLLTLAIPGVAYVYLNHSIPVVSEASRRIGELTAHLTKPEDVVFTNFAAQNPPFASWDTGSLGGTRFVADRLIYFDVREPQDIERLEQALGRNCVSAVVVLNNIQPVSKELRDLLASKGRPFAREHLTVPSQPTTLAHRLRELVWTLSGRFSSRSRDKEQASGELVLEFYRIK